MTSTCSFSYGVFPRSENKMHVLFPLRCTRGVESPAAVTPFQILRRILKPTVARLVCKTSRSQTLAIGIQNFLSLSPSPSHRYILFSSTSCAERNCILRYNRVETILNRPKEFLFQWLFRYINVSYNTRS